MLRERYTPLPVCDLVPTWSLARDPVLAQSDRLRDDATLVQTVAAELACRVPRPLRDGRPATPVAVSVRLLVAGRLYGWSAEATEPGVADSLVRRPFGRGYLEPVPDDTALLRWATLLTPATLVVRNERLVALARASKVPRGRKLRVDSLVVEPTMHTPTDSALLGDGVRVLSRLGRRATAVMGQSPSLNP
jgi:transposase, IS5 family